MWWLALAQFLICGLFGLLAIVAIQVWHIPAEEKNSYIIVCFVSLLLALFGLAFMSVLH